MRHMLELSAHFFVERNEMCVYAVLYLTKQKKIWSYVLLGHMVAKALDTIGSYST